ncbi:MAG: helix-turn-helix domain-containing protein [Hyphomicrobiales bacterium]
MQGRTLSRAQISSIVKDSVCRAMHVSVDDIERSERGVASVAIARHFAIYLCHVVAGLNYSELAIEFHRDRTTIRHACLRIEMLRDYADSDSVLACLETGLLAFFDTMERVWHESIYAIENNDHVNFERFEKRKRVNL